MGKNLLKTSGILAFIAGILLGVHLTSVAFAQGAGAVPAPVSPVMIYDDMVVYGNSTQEPGNLFVRGNLYALGNVQTANAAQIGNPNGSNTHTLSGQVSVLGDTNVSGNVTVGGGLSVASDVRITGNVFVNGQRVTGGGGGGGGGGGIGVARNSAQNLARVRNAQWVSSTVKCTNAAQRMLACDPQFDFGTAGTPPQDFFWLSSVAPDPADNRDQCRISAKFGPQSITRGDFLEIRATAVCGN